MTIKLGDMVIRKDLPHFALTVTGFEDECIFLKGIEHPITTYCTEDELIKLNRERNNHLRRVK